MNVSVIIPVYKAGPFVRKAVESALMHEEVKEIVLVEDGSPDNSWEECQTLAADYPIVRLYCHPGHENKGAGASRNFGLKQASQEYVCFLDADDYFTSVRFEQDNRIFKLNAEADGVYGATGVHYYDNKGSLAWQKRGYEKDHIDAINKPIAPSMLFEYLLGVKYRDLYNGIFTIDALTLKKDKLNTFQINFSENLRLHQDSEFLLKCAYFLRLYPGSLEDPIAIRGVHGDNRFIHHSNLDESRSKYYKSLMIWAKENSINQELQYFIKSKYLFHHLANKGELITFPLVVYYFLSNHHYREFLITREYIRFIKFKKSSLFTY